MRIPVENIYYLLCYAWNRLEEKNIVKVDIDDSTELFDLLAHVLIRNTTTLLKRGIEQDYISHTNEVHGIKGKLQFSESVKKNILRHQKTVCSYDEFSPDVLNNQILVTTLYRLSRVKGLDNGLKKILVNLIKMFPSISRIHLSANIFNRIRLHRNNQCYRFALNVCRLIYENTIPSENEGEYLFSDFTRDDRKMAHLFEEFIRNFYKIEQNTYKTKREYISWQMEETKGDCLTYLPRMETDITLESPETKIIIDAKYYSNTMAINYRVEKIHSQNLYQLFSYLINQRNGSHKNENAMGILLYPTIEHDYDLHYKYDNHKIILCTVNLNMNWKKIEERLKMIIAL